MAGRGSFGPRCDYCGSSGLVVIVQVIRRRDNARDGGRSDFSRRLNPDDDRNR